MALFVTGKKFIQDVETAGAVGVYVPLEGGFEGRYKRRIRAAGYATLFVSAPGIGDLASYLTGIHGVRPPHVGKNAIRTFFLPPFVSYQLENLPPKAKGLVLWLYDGQRLSQEELAYLKELTKTERRLKVVVELGGARDFMWKPLTAVLAAA
ncbi:NAD(P)H-quinone oxidoreductase subunit N [Altericista sp. CCNU0014]|uniref:NAD(P)H-quinone oxidoreductase subunit N n=1 Tax=Altericista sp. CCNU0014 TaxID=3082949 RepID=UPI00384DA072